MSKPSTRHKRRQGDVMVGMAYPSPLRPSAVSLAAARDLARDALYDASREIGIDLTRAEVNKLVNIDGVEVRVVYADAGLPSPKSNDMMAELLDEANELLRTAKAPVWIEEVNSKRAFVAIEDY